MAVNDFSQPWTVQRKGLSLVLRFQRRCECSWERMCLVRFPDCRKFFPQPGYLQGKGRSPVWIRTCCTRFDDWRWWGWGLCVEWGEPRSPDRPSFVPPACMYT